MSAPGLPVAVTARVAPTAPTLWLVADARASRAARTHVEDQLTDWGTDEETIADAVLLASELTENVAQHSRSRSVGISVSATDSRVAVGIREQAASDLTGPDDHVLLDFAVDAPPTPPAWKTSGRGLKILDALASEWGISRTHRSTSTWFSLTPATHPPLQIAGRAGGDQPDPVPTATEREPLQLLQDLTEQLASATTPRQIGVVVAEGLRHHVDAVFIALVEPGGDTMRYLVRATQAGETRARDASDAADDMSPVPAATLCEEPIFVDGLELGHASPGKFGHLEVAGTRAVAQLPLIVDGRTFGALGVAWDQPRTLGADTRAVLTVVAGACALALDRVRRTDAPTARRATGRA